MYKIYTYRIIESPVAEVDTHLHTDAEEPGNEVITLQNTLLLKLGVGGEEPHEKLLR